ncbi:unnamed protein product [Nippostrongylus brasiliensis]|uniref:Uncharacterized protein n=1 Tax=Nippostrongylus brasiliensis TaxID=27835 RepID=A0A0N4XFG2_NIPBR|nr:unnamed protein product [Nippostrongylus brasiliensis]
MRINYVHAHPIQENSRHAPTDIYGLIMDMHTSPSPPSTTPAEQLPVQEGRGVKPEAATRAEKRPQRT